jgi:hypothetical protein
MAIYHCGIKIISRGNNGKSAVAAAAYRAAEKIKNEYDGRTSDYTRKGGVIYSSLTYYSQCLAGYFPNLLRQNAPEYIKYSVRFFLAY